MRTRWNRAVAGVVTLALGVLAPGIGRADPGIERIYEKVVRSEGCVAVGTHAVSFSTIRPWDCYYRATGPSVFAAATTNPFVISVSRNNGKTWTDLYKRATPGAFTAGTVATKPGDLVSVSISCWDYVRARSCSDLIGGRHGVLTVHSEI
ncbi:MAG: hypothetical protein ACLGH3_09905 [Actinomycetota bacterium]